MGDLGQISLVVVTAAMTAYLVSLIAFSIDLTRSAKTLPQRSRKLAAVGGGDAGNPAAAPARSGADNGIAQATPSSARRAAGIGMATCVLGTALMLLGIVTRGFAAGRVPWANMYEFTLMAVFIASAVFLGLQRTRDVRYLGTFVSGLAVVSLFLALAVLYTQPDAVQALQSYWLIIHVSIATAATGVLAVGALFSVVQLLKERSVARGGRGRVFGSLPGAADLERIAYRLNAVGFVLWTFTVIAGAIWAEHAWGRFWGWDAKEVGSFVVWVIYAAYLHARATVGWDGRRAAWFSIAGFLAVLANYYVVNLFLPSLHSYSGV